MHNKILNNQIVIIEIIYQLSNNISKLINQNPNISLSLL